MARLVAHALAGVFRVQLVRMDRRDREGLVRKRLVPGVHRNRLLRNGIRERDLSRDDRLIAGRERNARAGDKERTQGEAHAPRRA